MTKILLIILIFSNSFYCSSYTKKTRTDFIEIKNKIKTKEEILVESAVEKYNLDIKVKTIKFNKEIEKIYNLDDDENKYIYFHGKKSKHLKMNIKLWGHYWHGNNIITINKDIVFNFNKEKQVGVVTHEIGHMLGLKHYDNGCNFMLSGTDSCQTYNYKQINVLKKYVDNNLSKGDKDAYMFDKKEYLKIIDDIKLNKTMTLYLILD